MSAILLLVVPVVLASGCGGSSAPSTEALAASVVATRDRVDFALARITRAQSKDDLLERMDDAANAIDDATGDLEDVGAPENLEADVSMLVDSLRQLAFDVQATADQIRQPGFDLITGTKGLSFESWDAVNRALARLGSEGVEAPPLERH